MIELLFGFWMLVTFILAAGLVSINPFLNARVKNMLNPKASFGVAQIRFKSGVVKHMVVDYTKPFAHFKKQDQGIMLDKYIFGNVNGIPTSIHNDDDIDAIPVFESIYPKDKRVPLADFSIAVFMAEKNGIVRFMKKLESFLGLTGIAVVFCAVAALVAFFAWQNAGSAASACLNTNALVAACMNATKTIIANTSIVIPNTH